jgi:Kef-type K+ transport system membrane component KefB
MGLLVLSYIGSFLVGGRAVRGIGLPSGAEYVALGFVLGPHALGVVERSTLDSFDPIAHVALGWLAFVIGLDFGFAGNRPVRASTFLYGIVSSALTGGAVFGAVWLFVERFPVVPRGADQWLLAGGVATACAETTRHAVRWVVERYDAKGPLSVLFNEISHVDDLLPIVGLAVVVACSPNPAHVTVLLPKWAWLAATPALGVVLGVVAAALIGAEFSLNATWGVLFGVTLLAIGVAVRFDVSALATTFFMGLTLAIASSHRRLLREAVAPTERPVLLPALLLAGARIDVDVFRTNRLLFAVVAVAIASRIVGKLVSAAFVRATLRPARGVEGSIGLSLLSSGALSMSIGLALAMRFPGKIGDTVLAAAAACAIFGEFVAPASLRRVLTSAGEIVEVAPPPPASQPASNASAPPNEETAP